MEKKKLDETITTVRDFVTATKHINPDAQIYVQLDEDSALIEITELLLRLPKYEYQLPYLILRAK